MAPPDRIEGHIERYMKDKSAPALKTQQYYIPDLFARKIAEEKLKQQKDFLVHILESLDHPFYVINTSDFTISLANNATCDGPLAEGTTCYALTHRRSKPCGSEKHPCPVEIVKQTKKSTVVEHVHYDRDGNEKNVEVHACPVFDEKGNVAQVIEYALDITERIKAAQRMTIMNRALLGLGTDHKRNVDLITEAAGDILGGICSLYNRLEGPILCSIGMWRTPADLNPRDNPEGHICYDVILKNVGECFVVRDLQHTPYADSDPNVRAHGLQTYIGHVVRAAGKPVGSLCVVFVEDKKFTSEELGALGALAGAMGVEEERYVADMAVSERVMDIERMDKFMIGREAKIIEMKKEINELLEELSQPPRYKL
jgi:GAF domain-containing protein